MSGLLIFMGLFFVALAIQNVGDSLKNIHVKQTTTIKCADDSKAIGEALKLIERKAP